MKKEKLIKVFESTVEDLKRGFYLNNSKEISFSKVSKLRKSKYFSSEEIQSLSISNYCEFPNAVIYAQNIDCIEKAIEFGKNCVLLNMASAMSPGGNVFGGSNSQEEELCRRTNLVYSLYSFQEELGRKILGFTRSKLKSRQYPIDSLGAIYSPCVNIYKDKNYITLQNPVLCNVISAPAFLYPELDSETGMLKKKYVPIVKKKIRAVLRIALYEGHTKLVLGAWGCGSYRNPPKHIAQLFDEVLKEPEFSRVFEEICFAILDNNVTRSTHNPEGNLAPFVDKFGLYVD